MHKPAFIVDGHTEQTFISTICPGRPIQRTNLNGKKVTIEAIAKNLASKIRVFGNRYHPIIILIDKEERKDDISILCCQLCKALANEGITDQDIRVGFADIMIENWIIADYKLIGDISKKPTVTDGLKGANVIKKHLKVYNKVIDGVKLLTEIDKTTVYRNSPSYKSFIDKIEDLECQYLNFER